MSWPYRTPGPDRFGLTRKAILQLRDERDGKLRELGRRFEEALGYFERGHERVKFTPPVRFGLRAIRPDEPFPDRVSVRVAIDAKGLEHQAEEVLVALDYHRRAEAALHKARSALGLEPVSEA